MSIFTRTLNQDVTYWPVTGSDGYGGFAFGPPQVLRGRWEEKNELFITIDNEEITSKAIVYLNTDITNGSYLALGNHLSEANPGNLSPAYRIQAIGKVTDLRALNALRKAWL